MKKSNEDLISFRLQRSESAFSAARILIETSQWNDAVNRLYYAVFYSVSALLIKYETYAKSHSGLKSKFHEVLVKEGKVDYEVGKTYDELFKSRQDADYSDFLVFAKEEVEDLMDRTKHLLTEINKLIN